MSYFFLNLYYLHATAQTEFIRVDLWSFDPMGFNMRFVFYRSGTNLRQILIALGAFPLFFPALATSFLKVASETLGAYLVLSQERR